MILIITNKDDVTVDYIVRELSRRNLPYYRLNTEDIPENVYIDFNFTKNTFLLRDIVKDCTIDLNSITSVYFRRPQISLLNHVRLGVDDIEYFFLRRETAQILEGIYKILEDKYWINNVYRIREGENKIHQLLVAKKIGFLTPDAILSNCPEYVRDFLKRHAGGCIIKPIRSGGMGDEAKKVIFTSKIEHIPEDRQINCFPLYLQDCIKKDADLRVVTIGERVYCARIESQKDLMAQIDWRRSNEILKHSVHILPDRVKELCLEITNKLGLAYSAIDLVLTKDGKYVFLECNPNGQWAWLEERLGFPISKNIVNQLWGHNA